ncbi:MAG: hypothetical protein OCD01_02485 [Fibrobacterales bacterium]
MKHPMMTLIFVCYTLFLTQNCIQYSETPKFQEYQVDIDNETDLPVHTIEVSINSVKSHTFTSQDDFDSDDSSIELTFPIPNSQEQQSTVEIICKSYGLTIATILRTVSDNAVSKSKSRYTPSENTIAFLQKNENVLKKENISNLVDFTDETSNNELENLFGSDDADILDLLISVQIDSSVASSDSSNENDDSSGSNPSSESQPLTPSSSDDNAPESSDGEDSSNSSLEHLPNTESSFETNELSSSFSDVLEEEITFTITVNKGSNKTESITIRQKSEIKLSIDPVAPDGYEFDKWDSGPGCSLKYADNSMNTKLTCTKNEVIDAIFTPKKYTIAISAIGNCGSVNNETLYYTMDGDNVIIDTELNEYCDPEYSSDDLQLSEHIITGIQDEAYDNPVLNATVTFNEITVPQATISITCQADNIDIACADVSEELPSSVTIKEDDDPKIISTTAAWGFTFSSLKEESNADVSSSTIGYKKSGEGQVIAQYTRKAFTVTFNSTPAHIFSESASVKYQIPSQIAAPDAPFGYRFSGWAFNDKDCTIPGATGQSITYSCYVSTTVTAEYEELTEGTFWDRRGSGTTYKWIKIEDEFWMDDNLNYSVSNSRCYIDKSEYCQQYGRLYQWTAAMQIDTLYSANQWSGTETSHLGICPEGWHMPTANEWNTLTALEHLGFNHIQYGGQMHPYMGGYRPDGEGSSAIYWSSSQASVSKEAHNIWSSISRPTTSGEYDKRSYYAVRCKRDN